MLSVNFAKFLRTTLLTAHLRRLFLYVHSGNFKLNAGYTDIIKMLSTKRYYQQNEWWKEKITVCTKYFFLHNALRRFYTRRNISGMSQWHRFFFFFFGFCTCVAVLSTDTFLKFRFWWKVQIISTFLLRTNVAFYLSKSFLSIHLNKWVIVTWLIHSPW